MENQNNTSKIIMHPASVEELVKRRNVILVKPYTLKELAMLYGVCPRTVKNWIHPFQEEIGNRTGRFYSVKQARIIFDNLGVPYSLQLDFAEAA